MVGLGFVFDLLTSGLVHAEVLPCTVCLLLAQAIFLLECGQTDATERPTPRRRPYSRRGVETKNKENSKQKLAPYGTDGRLFRTDVSANFKVTWHKN